VNDKDKKTKQGMKRSVIDYLFWIVALLASLFSSCHIDRETEARAEQALQEVGERYHAEKSICDSLLDVATSYYLPDLAKGDTTLSSFNSSAQQAECMLYEGIRHHDRAQQLKPDMEAYAAEMTKAYRLFLEVERNVDLLAEPYLKGVINDRMAIINVQNENYREALSYFRKELFYSFQTKDTTVIASSYTRLAFSYFTLDDGDSALYYSDSALYFAPHLDNRALSTLYANTAYYQQKFGIKKERSERLLSQIPFERCTRNDSCRIFVILADYYMEQGNYGKVDSLLQWTIAHSDNTPEILSMSYLRRSNLFEQMGMYDSALIQQKLCREQRDLFNQSGMRKEVAEAHGRYERMRQQQDFHHIVAAIVLVSILIIVALLVLWLRRIQRMKKLELRIKKINAIMEQYAADIKRQQESFKQREATFKQQEENLDKEIIKSQFKEKELKKKIIKLRSEKRASHSKIVSMLRRFFLLNENAPWPTSIYEELLDIYRTSSSKRSKLLDELHKIDLSPRHKVICLLMSEDKYETDKLWFYAGCVNEESFQSTKSQIKRKLVEAASPSKEIQDLLRRFPLDRGPAEKRMPLKKEGKK
jgi:hypothetical protein